MVLYDFSFRGHANVTELAHESVVPIGGLLILPISFILCLVWVHKTFTIAGIASSVFQLLSGVEIELA